jgi:hypothetical protein
MKKIKTKLPVLPDLKEYIDQEGKKWIQTSADDLLSSKELLSVLNALEKQKSADDIVLARIDFQKVNKEYYEAVLDLQAKLEKQNAILKKLLVDAKQVIDKKNNKLKELIDYIKKLYMFIAYNNKISPEEIEKIMTAQPPAAAPVGAEEKAVEEIVEKRIIEYTDVEEVLLD